MSGRFRFVLRWTGFALSGVTLLVANEGSSPLSDFVKHRFVQQVSSGLKDYRVCEAFSRDDEKKAFFKKSFDVDVFAGAQNFESREIFVEEGAGKDLRRVHLGILTLRYSNAAAAAGIHGSLSKQGGFFKGTEVLTRFVPIHVDQALLVVYSESVQNEHVKSFMEAIEAQVKDEQFSSP